MKKVLIPLSIFILIIIVLIVWHDEAKAPAPENKQTQSTQTPPPTSTQTFNKSQYSLDTPSSIWVVVNKKRPLPESYAPSDLVSVGSGEQMRTEAATALKNLITTAGVDGVLLKPISGYRSYQTQVATYNGYVAKDGQAAADTYSARPGHSEHQTGLAIDLGNTSGQCALDICFGNTPGGQWLRAHAYQYGFVIRYPEDKTAVTGYQPEPWHLRYVGKELAKKLFDSGQTMEEFFALPAAPSY